MRRRRAMLGLALLALLAVLGGGAAWARSRAAGPSPVLYSIALTGDPAALAVDGRTGRVFVTVAHPGAQGSGSMLDADNGAVLAPLAVSGMALAVDERAGTVVAVGIDGVNMLDAATGRFLRQVDVTTDPDTVAVDARAGHTFVVSSGDDTVHMLDTRTGAVLRTETMVMMPDKVAVDADAGQAYVTSGSPFASVLDTRNGDPVRTAVLRASSGPLAIDGRMGHIFVLDPPGNSVAMLDERDGLVLHVATVGRFPVALAVDARRGRAYVISRDDATSFNPTDTGSVAVVDTRTGAVLRTIPVGVDPSAIALDEDSGRVFVATRGGAVVVPDAWRWMPAWLRDRLPFLPPPGPHLRVLSPIVTALAVPT